MKNLTVARRYASAFYQLARETKTTKDVLQGMSNLCSAIKSTPKLDEILKNPLVKPEEKANVVKTITSNKLILKFVTLLARRKRMDLIPLVYDELVALSDVEEGVRRILVKTASHLSDAQKKNIEKELAKSFDKKVIGHFEMARELLGGMWIKMGDKVLDATIRGRFEDLRRYLVHSTN
jgi:F-type H+-transporting ATPase subunit delta